MKNIKNIIILLITGCAMIALAFFMTKSNKVTAPTIDHFKESYESINDQDTGNGNKYRHIELNNTDIMKEISLTQLIDRINNKETFIVYFGFTKCPWCRSVLPTALNVAKEKNISNIFYINTRPDGTSDSEIRDVYSNDGKKVILTHNGTEEYHTLLDLFKDVLPDYNNHGVVVKGVKRIGAPNFILVKEGKAIEKITGISDKQTDGYMELTDEINNDMQKAFSCFYDNYLSCLDNNVCTSKAC